MKATWQGQLLAESNETVEVEGNAYFPPTAIHAAFFHASDHTSFCPWKGTAHYYHLEVDGKRSDNAAWYYPKASDKAKHIEGYVAFWKDVVVSE